MPGEGEADPDELGLGHRRGHQRGDLTPHCGSGRRFQIGQLGARTGPGGCSGQGIPGNQSCKWNGSCASPVNASRVSSAGVNKGKSVWKLARKIFEQRMWEAGVPFGPSPGEGYPDDLVPTYESGYEDCPKP